MAASTTHQRGGGRVPVVTCTASNGYDSLQQVMMARTTSRRSNDDDDDDDRLLMADESSRLLSTPRLQHHSKNDDEVELVDHHAAHDRCSTAGDHVSARSPPPSSPPDSSTRGRHPLLCWRYHHHHRRRHTAAAGGGGRRGGGGDGSSTSTIATRGGCGGLRRHTLRCAAMASILVSFLCVIVALLQVIPSHHELNLAYDQSLSVWSVGRIREAQSLALQSAHFLNKNNANAAGGGGGGEEEEEPEYWSLRAMHNLMKIGQGNGLRNHKAGPPPRKYMEPPEGCESTVLIVRHCEKGSVREHCAHVGFERAVYLATQFGSHPHERWPSPSYIFAEGPGERRNTKKMNFREIETVGPLSEKVGVKVDDSYTTETVNDLARQILTVLQSGQMCGKLTLISWKHSNIGHLAHRLGCGPEQGCPVDYRGSDFDKAWQIKFAYRTPEHSSHKDLTLTHKPLWNIAGSVQSEGFDPLAFSKAAGDYPPGGTSWGARWEKSEVSYPERSDRDHTSQWKATRVGFTEGTGDTNDNDTHSGGH